MIRIESTSKIYKTGRGEVKALDGVSLEVKAGEFVALKGPSGSGKTTLLLTLGGMLSPSKGKVMVEGKDLYTLSPGERAGFRAKRIGFVFQMYFLVPYLTTLENVLLARQGARPVNETEHLLERLGLSHRMNHKPSELSIGERQRAAIARALLNKPGLILADEPTGNLDPENAKEALDHLKDFNREGGTVVVVTHGDAVDAYARRTLMLKEGRLQQEKGKEVQ